jgi:FHA domain-containing protein
MKLTALRRTDDQAFAPIQADFDVPGGTIGRGRENRLVLDDEPGAMCRVQAVLRISDTACYLANLSGMGGVSVNGHVVAPNQETVVRHGDEVTIGAYVLHADDAVALPPQPEPAPDVFGDLIGPGTLPVGSAPDVGAHPFDMASAATRNPEDPLAQLPRDDMPLSGTGGDPLRMFGGADADKTGHVFSDTTPTTLPSHGPLAPYGGDPIGDTLGRPAHEGDTHAARNDVDERGGYMRAPTVRRDK